MYIFKLYSSVYLNEDEKQQQTCVNDAYQWEKWALLAVSSFVFFSTLLFQSLHLSSCHWDLTSHLVTSSIWSPFGGRVGSGVCAPLRLYEGDPDGAPGIVQLGGGKTSRGKAVGAPVGRHLRFPCIDSLGCPGVRLSPVCSPHDSRAGGQDNHRFSSFLRPLYKFLPVWVSSIPPPLLYMLRHPHPYSLSILPGFSFPWSGETSLRGEGRGGVLASLSGASGNLISQQRQTGKRRAGGNLSFTDCIFNTEVIFYRHWIRGCICTHRHTQGTHLYVYTLEKHISCPPLVM